LSFQKQNQYVPCCNIDIAVRIQYTPCGPTSKPIPAVTLGAQASKEGSNRTSAHGPYLWQEFFKRSFVRPRLTFGRRRGCLHNCTASSQLAAGQADAESPAPFQGPLPGPVPAVAATIGKDTSRPRFCSGRGRSACRGRRGGRGRDEEARVALWRRAAKARRVASFGGLGCRPGSESWRHQFQLQRPSSLLHAA